MILQISNALDGIAQLCDVHDLDLFSSRDEDNFQALALAHSLALDFDQDFNLLSSEVMQ